MAKPNEIFRLTPPAEEPEPPEASEEPVVRLLPTGHRPQRDLRHHTPAPVVPTSPAAESSGLDFPELPPERLDVEAQPARAKRSQEPGIEQILDLPEDVPQIEDHWGGQTARRTPVPWGWFLLLGLLLAGGAFWSTWQVGESEQKVEATREVALAEVTKDEEATRQAEQLLARIETAIRSYFAAKTIDEIVPWVRHPQRVRPLMEAWYRDHPLKPDPFRHMAEFLPQNFGGTGSFWTARVQLASGRFHAVYLEELPDGSVKIDWATCVGYQPMAWDDYAARRPAGDFDFRVTAQPDNLFSHEFADSERWLCFRLTAPNSEEFLYGYVERDRPLAQLLESHFRQNGGRPAQLILRLNTPTGLNSPRGVRIEDLLSIRWIYLVNPDGGA
ncbi:MAG TPA: hypothetical protein VIM46_07190 [Luteolibacter sp.]